jgi:hypothetical protein
MEIDIAMLQVIRGYAADRDRIEQRIRDAVALARRDGASWEDIAAALGRSAVATEGVYSHVDYQLSVIDGPDVR